MRYLKSKRMVKKLAVVFLWFLIVPLTLIATSTLLYQTTNIKPNLNFKSSQATESFINQNNLQGQVLGAEITDMRPYIVENFLKNTQLENYSEQIVEASDKYGINWRLIPAIAMRESGGGDKARPGSFNAWGFENGRTNFDSWESAIESVAKTLRIRYVDKGMTTPEEIMAVYAPPQLSTGGKWAQDINYFFSKLETL